MYMYHYTYGVGRPPWALGVPWDRPEVTMRAHDMLEHASRAPVFLLFLPGGCFQKNTKKVTRAAFPAAQLTSPWRRIWRSYVAPHLEHHYDVDGGG